MEQWPPTDELLRRLYGTAEPVESTAWDMPSFLAAYTLHDSSLAEVRLTRSDGLLIFIDWDMHWNRKVRQEYNNLIIGIPMVYSVAWSQGGWSQSTLGGATSERVAESERNAMLENGTIELRAFQGAKDEIPPAFEDEGLTRTTFDRMNWSRMTILHGGEARFLCLDDHGKAGPMPRDLR
jgi:hypothetical protein